MPVRVFLLCHNRVAPYFYLAVFPSSCGAEDTATKDLVAALVQVIAARHQLASDAMDSWADYRKKFNVEWDRFRTDELPAVIRGLGLFSYCERMRRYFYHHVR